MRLEFARDPRGRAPSERWLAALLLVPLAFNVLHALVIVAVYRNADLRSLNVLNSLGRVVISRDTAELQLQIWLLASGLTLLAQLDLVLRHRRWQPKRSIDVSDRGASGLRLADWVVLVLALGTCAMQATFLGFALFSPVFGPQQQVGFASTSGNWGRLLWAYYALAATPLAYLQVLALTPWRAVSLIERGALGSKSARSLLGSCVVLGVVTLGLSELVVDYL